MTKVDTEKYLEFVKGVTSAPSLDYGAMGSRLAELEVNGTNVSVADCCSWFDRRVW